MGPTVDYLMSSLSRKGKHTCAHEAVKLDDLNSQEPLMKTLGPVSSDIKDLIYSRGYHIIAT